MNEINKIRIWKAQEVYIRQCSIIRSTQNNMNTAFCVISSVEQNFSNYLAWS
jgi:3-methyladenine DNA glycosylase/8-oxoguanine DNA glycosylase